MFYCFNIDLRLTNSQVMILGQDWSLAKEALQNYCLTTHYTDLVWFDFIVSTDLWVPDSFFVDTTIWRGTAAHPTLVKYRISPELGLSSRRC